ncbi:MAG: metallophosphoesterase [Minicystis sp.]
MQPRPSPFHLSATGRGRNYTRLRGLTEAAMRLCYQRSWPARVWGLIPGVTRVTRLDHQLVLDPQHRLRSPLRLAFVSDLHLGPTTPRATLDAAFTLLREAAPDVLVLGGDYVFLDATQARADELRDRVAAVPARTKIAVMGNHDLWTDHGLLERALAEAGATVLINDALRLPAPHDEVAILGLDDPWTGQPDGARAIAACRDAPLRIAVSHSPEGLPYFRGGGVSLLLSGHTHGGQIALPGPRPIIVPGPLSKRWPFGRHEVEGLTLFVSRGVGTGELPIRTFAPPDIAVFTLS